MKKLLSIFSAIGITATAAPLAVSCGIDTDYKAPKSGVISDVKVPKPDKKGIVNGSVLARRDVAASLTVKQVEDNFVLFTLSNSKNKNQRVALSGSNAEGILVPNVKVTLTEPFYAGQLNKPKSDKLVHVEVKINWAHKATNVVSNDTYYVGYKLDNNHAIIIANFDVHYKAVPKD